MMENRDTSPENEPAEFKKIAKCGICSQWFGDHTTMLTHLQTHSDNYNCKNFTCHVCKKSFKEQWQLVRHEVSTLTTWSFRISHLSLHRIFKYKLHLPLDRRVINVPIKLHTLATAARSPSWISLCIKSIRRRIWWSKHISARNAIRSSSKKYHCSLINAQAAHWRREPLRKPCKERRATTAIRDTNGTRPSRRHCHRETLTWECITTTRTAITWYVIHNVLNNVIHHEYLAADRCHFPGTTAWDQSRNRRRIDAKIESRDLGV